MDAGILLFKIKNYKQKVLPFSQKETFNEIILQMVFSINESKNISIMALKLINIRCIRTGS